MVAISEWEKTARFLVDLVSGYEAGSDGFLSLCDAIKRVLPLPEFDELKNLVENGPVWDGDTISPTTRDSLIRCKLAVKVIVKGQFGYQCSTHLGHWVLKGKNL